MPPQFQRAIVSVTNDLATDNRVHRTCTVLQELGYDVLLVGRKLRGSLPVDRPYRTRRLRLFFNKGPLFYAEYNLRLSFLLCFSRATLFFSNDLDTLLPNFIAARIRGKRLVYDTHEFFTEVPELVARHRVRAVWLAMERWIFPKLDTVITVNRSIAQAYRERYGKQVHVVRNIPMPRVLGPVPPRQALDLPPDKRILVLQGSGINVDRGAEEAVLAMCGLPDCLLLVIGSGDAWPVLQDLVCQHALDGRVRLIGKMPYERMMDYTRNADLGLTLDKDTNLNYRFSLPNKLFDYLHAGIPVLATDLPEVAGIVREMDCGVVIAAPTPGAVQQAVEDLFADPARCAALKAHAARAATLLDGTREAEALRTLLQAVR